MKITKSGIVVILSTVICFFVFGGVLVSEGVADILFPYSAGVKEVSVDAFAENLREGFTPVTMRQDKDEVDLPQQAETEKEPQTEQKAREFSELEAIPEGSLPIKSYTITPASYLEGMDGVYIINEDNKSYSLKSILENPFIPSIEKNNEPEVLIVHTHATESYNEYYANYYYKSDSYRSEDNAKNMVNIGNIIAGKLEESGIKVIHSTLQCDNPNYNKSYSNSNAEIRKYLEKYPSIKLVLDVHRDTLISDSGTKYRPVTTIDGSEVAQVMILLGAGNDTYPNDVWLQNLELAAQVQKTASEMFPKLMRPILLRDSRYNQHLLAGSMLVEVGTCANTQPEAERAALYFSEALIKALKQ